MTSRAAGKGPLAHQVIPNLASSLRPKKTKDTPVILKAVRFQVWSSFCPAHPSYVENKTNPYLKSTNEASQKMG